MQKDKVAPSESISIAGKSYGKYKRKSESS